ncbi:MAG: twin-arginine translocase TatA/TatE family subunit [Rhodospirillales bacterium]
MGSFSIWHWLIVLVVVLILFGGGGKLSRLAGDLGKGITSFRKGLKEGSPEGETTAAQEPPKSIHQGATVDGVKKDEPVKG